ncbi:ABC transporter substrate-binding protein [Pseudomonas gingeri]|uniref:ABC transporter substrate-binding protein n=1 Tax=Pseudomonas gingeri TaxID=117681 RepID=A0A7Y7XGW8_9PSED|nr:ABC transporter substrate-binding protein [Pseudomonas gingeri]NWA28312.1 ABC transporter substrate-binding protein [Pseudomonas gingeri]NWB98578.1 ABC transporter substrate-binding protein [Pseudomonas gingeri]NWD71397.1 ABC transporter substrate-binding protein [Pseudomonas gingeri]NWD72843.1 ABC transporter substrate-binding protein [Pseudomonas gingeri]
MLKNLCKVVLILSLPFWAMAQATTVVFLNPGHATEPFWGSYTRFMQAAARNLGLELQVHYGDRNPQTSVAQAYEVLQSAHRPDYLVFVNEQSIAPQILRMAQGHGVKLFIVNNTLTADQGERFGEAPDLLGSLVQNDEQAGYLMLKELVRQRLQQAPGQPIDLLAFSGMKLTPASQLREQGLRRALAEYPQVHLRQLVYGEWSRQRAFDQAEQMIRRYPQTSLVWAANDEMALGAMAAFEKAGRRAGRDVLFSAVNNSPDALRASIDGRLSVLLAGHFTLGGWAMVLLRDDADGVDFIRHGGRERQIPVLELIDKAQAEKLLKYSVSEDYRVDFRALSARGKPDGYRYPFSLKTVLH